MVPDINQEDIDAVIKVLKSGMLVQGFNVKSLEDNIASYLGVKNAIAVCNGTASLHLALLALNIKEGDEVIVPAFSYVATANVVELVGATTIFVDIDLDTFNIDTSLIEAAITPRTKAIIPVHEFGLSCNIIEICSIAKKYSLKVVEDAACALGAKENERYVGTFGELGSFSFHPRKAITSGEGGLIVTNDDFLAERLRTLRNHGIQMNGDKMEFVAAGFNYRLTDFQAALVNSQFQRIDSILTCKQTLAALYLKHLEGNPNLQLPLIPPNKLPTWQSFHVLINGNRNELIKKMKEKGVGTNYGAQCIPYQKYYADKYKLDCESLYPNAMRAYKKGLVLPLYGSMQRSDVKRISEILIS